MRFKVFLIVLVVGLHTVGCGGSEATQSDGAVPPADTQTRADSASPDTASPDTAAPDTASPPSDTSTPGDTAEPALVDTAQPDTSTPPIDGGDAGVTPEPVPVEVLLENWYDDYNAGSDLSYLSASYTLLSEGAPEHPMAVAHEAHIDVPYGPYTRNRLDFYLPKGGTGPLPVAVYIHGGGYVGGDKEQVHNPAANIDRFLEAGIAVAAISYRWAYKNAALALEAPVPNDIGEEHNVNGTRLDFIHRDCARAVQFLRYKAADWGLDKARMGAYGGSAGAACAMWTATIPDLADPEAEDPVLRESTDLIVVGHVNSQPSMNFTRWPLLLDLPADFVFDLVGEKAQALGQMTIDDQIDTELGQQLSLILDYYEHLGPEGPALFTQNGKEDSDETTITDASTVIHHPRGHVALYSRCVEMGLECAIVTPMLHSGYRGDVIQFLTEQLTKP